MAIQVDPAEVLEALRFPAAGPATPVTGGWDTALWRFPTADGNWHALRLFRADQAATAGREQVAMRAAAAGGLPIPAIEAAGVWQERPALVLRWADGVPLFNALQSRPWALLRLAAAFARTQARLHTLPAPETLQAGAPGYWLQAAGLHEPALIERLRALPVRTDCLVHLDYHPLNVLANGTGITAVLDWSNGAAGDRRADVARTAALVALAPIPASALLRPVFELVRRLFYRAWARAYRQAAGPMIDLAPFMAWAGAKFLADTERRLGQPQVWATERDLVVMRRWIRRWKAHARIA